LHWTAHPTKVQNTEDAAKLGANAILGVSLAFARAGACAKDVPLYEHIADLAGIPKTELTLPV